MAVESDSAYALDYVRFRMCLSILGIDALCIYQQKVWEGPSAAHMLPKSVEAFASGLDCDLTLDIHRLQTSEMKISLTVWFD